MSFKSFYVRILLSVSMSLCSFLEYVERKMENIENFVVKANTSFLVKLSSGDEFSPILSLDVKLISQLSPEMERVYGSIISEARYQLHKKTIS